MIFRYTVIFYNNTIVFLYCWPGLHLGNDSRRGKIRFYESKGGDGVKICLCKHTASRGSGGMPPGNFRILDSLRLLLVHSQVPKNDQK